MTDLDVKERIRIFDSGQGHRLLGIISPICNEPGCSTDACHVHPQGKQILGALDVVISLKETDNEILLAEKGVTGLAMVVFLLTSTIIFILVLKFVNQPVKKLIEGTRSIGRGELWSTKCSGPGRMRWGNWPPPSTRWPKKSANNSPNSIGRRTNTRTCSSWSRA